MARGRLKGAARAAAKAKQTHGRFSCQTVLRQSNGRLRLIWILLIGVAVYAFWLYGLRIALNLGFAALFRAWGVDASNIVRAPVWARLIYQMSGSLISLVVSLGCALSFLLPAAKRGEGKSSLRECGLATATGTAVVLAGTILFLILDSMRLYRPLTEPALHGALALQLLVYACAALAEEAFLRGYLFRHCLANAGKLLAMLLCAVVSFVIGTGWNLSALGMLNLVLQSFLCCLIYARGGVFASAGYRFAWSAAAGLLFAYPGASVSVNALWRLYHVSEAWLTGGNGGLISGLWMTLCLLAIGFFLAGGNVKVKKTIKHWTHNARHGKL